MGKKTDKMYMTAREWETEFGGAKKAKTLDEFKRLPFSSCALTFTPFENPVATVNGTVFDLVNIIPWLKKHGTDPISGEPLEVKDLVKLNWSKNANNEYQCPITFKVFNDNTHIVFIKPSGNVYAFDAIEELNLKPKYFKDLLTDEKFTRKDIIAIQDPHKLQSRNLLAFDFIKKGYQVKKDVRITDIEGDPGNSINAKGSTSRILQEIAAKKIAENPVETQSFLAKEKKAYNEAHFSTGLAAYSLTSMSFTPNTKTIAATISDEEFLFKKVKDKGLIQIKTNLGDMEFELYCKEAPKTCYNMIKLAEQDYYNDSCFHRSIRNFMLQGGDPTGTGRGGESYWKKQFDDEFSPILKHDGRGILSMANKGKNTNTSQFFITYGSCPHLNNKHTIFGKLVKGNSVLDSCEAIGTSSSDVPLDPIKILSIKVIKNPFERLLKKEDILEEAKKAKKEKRERTEKLKALTLGTTDASDDIGKYLNKKRGSASVLSEESTERIKKRPTGFGSFDTW